MKNFNHQEIINELQNQYLKKDFPKIQIGDSIKVGVKIIEGNKERVQFYEGTVIAIKNSSINTTITVNHLKMMMELCMISIIMRSQRGKTLFCFREA